MTEEHNLHDEQTKQTIVANVEKYGCDIALFEADNYRPAFAYTTGLFKTYGHAEIICFGLRTDVMAAIINHAYELIKQGDTLVTNKPYNEFLEGYAVQFIKVDEDYYRHYVGYAGWFYKSFDFPLLQLVWPDKQNNFPWEEDFNPDWKFKQPLLDRNTDFKFYEERNLAVYTTKQAFEGEPILYVYHNADGDWQFHTSPQPNIEHARLVSLEEITKLDPSINDIHHLQLGCRAWRNSKDDDWQFEDSPAEE